LGGASKSGTKVTDDLAAILCEESSQSWAWQFYAVKDLPERNQASSGN
jgi:hypothetical protein